MGLLSKLFSPKKPKDPPLDRLPSTPHPLRGWTNLGLYEVHGINPKTKRSNKRHYEAFTEDHARVQALSDGLVEPITVEEIQSSMATEKQIELCKELGIHENFRYITMIDVGALIWRHDDKDKRKINDEEWAAACKAGYPMSALCGPTHYRYIMENGTWKYRDWS